MYKILIVEDDRVIADKIEGTSGKRGIMRWHVCRISNAYRRSIQRLIRSL